MLLVRVLGYLGLIPFALGILLELRVVDLGVLWGLKLFVTYGVAILCFLTGTWWGLELKNGCKSFVRPLVAVVLCLLAWTTLLIGSNDLSLSLLTGGFAAALLADLTMNNHEYTATYRSLRIQLSVVVLSLHATMLVLVW